MCQTQTCFDCKTADRPDLAQKVRDSIEGRVHDNLDNCGVSVVQYPNGSFHITLTPVGDIDNDLRYGSGQWVPCPFCDDSILAGVGSSRRCKGDGRVRCTADVTASIADPDWD